MKTTPNCPAVIGAKPTTGALTNPPKPKRDQTFFTGISNNLTEMAKLISLGNL